MTTKDKEKVMAAGFKIIRSDPAARTIRVMTSPDSWAILEGPFLTRLMRDRRLIELLKDPKIIAD